MTEYLSLTKGTVSQTLMVLERKGLIQKKPDKKDGRIVHFKYYEGGTKIFRENPTHSYVARSLEGSSESKQSKLLGELQQLFNNNATVKRNESLWRGVGPVAITAIRTTENFSAN